MPTLEPLAVLGREFRSAVRAPTRSSTVLIAVLIGSSERLARFKLIMART